MTEKTSILDALLKLKTVGYFLIVWGLTFFFRGLADITYYIYNYGAADFSESLAETSLYVIGDIAYIIAAIILWAIAAKLLQTKTKPTT